jgi:DNA polymerase-3 subunit delta'
VTLLTGHDSPWSEWLEALDSARLHHAWLLAGPKGLGKGLFARQAAARLVAEPGLPPPDWSHHPDILVLDHLPLNETEEDKKLEGKPFQTKRNISIDQVRQLQPRLTKKLEPGQRRVVIIDPIDDLERGAANALLKSLEEPRPATYFLLVAHRPGRLLPTIRSRCRILRFAPLADAEIERILSESAPEADAATRAAALAAAGGSPGAALEFLAQNLGGLHTLMQRLISEGDDHFALRGALTEEIGARPDRDRLAAALDLARAVVATELAASSRARQERVIAAHGELVRISGQVVTYNFDPALLVLEIGALLASLAMPRETA